MTFAFCWLVKCGLGCGEPVGRWGVAASRERQVRWAVKGEMGMDSGS